MKKTLLFIASTVLAMAQQGVTWNHEGAVRTQIGPDGRALVLQGGGAQTAPAIGLTNKAGQAFFCAAMPAGGTCSFYRTENGESREWLRIEAGTIYLIGPDGLIPAFSGTIPVGCSTIYLHGLAVGKDCT